MGEKNKKRRRRANGRMLCVLGLEEGGVSSCIGGAADLRKGERDS